jgi:hypothetical protein
MRCLPRAPGIKRIGDQLNDRIHDGVLSYNTVAEMAESCADGLFHNCSRFCLHPRPPSDILGESPHAKAEARRLGPSYAHVTAGLQQSRELDKLTIRR